MDKKPESHILVIFGASGDLAWRKLMPAIYDLYVQKMMHENVYILGVGRTEFTHEQYVSKIREGVEKFAQIKEKNETFYDKIGYLSLDTAKVEAYHALNVRLAEIKATGVADNIIFYLATPPDLFVTIPSALHIQGLAKESKFTGYRRIIIEKPFGTTLESAVYLNAHLAKAFKEHQIYRIDHYLGKETVQNLMVTRFSNSIFEPLWNRNYISHVEITASESIGIGSRGGYYDHSGALRDMFQNHLLQLLTYVAMEPPTLLDAESIRTEGLKVLQALRPVSHNHFNDEVIRGQYTASAIRGEKQNGYRDEKGVPPESRTETYAAIKLTIDNWRWSGVPFFVRTGKRLPTRVSEVVINFKPTPHHLFHENESILNTRNQLIIRIQPDEGILLNFGMKLPGPGYRVKNVGMDFHYTDLSQVYLPSAYERLLLDCMLGDATLFARGDTVEAAWRYVQPILDRWQNDPSVPLYGYPAGTWGPIEAERMIETQDMTWRYPCKNLTNSDEYCEL